MNTIAVDFAKIRENFRAVKRMLSEAMHLLSDREIEARQQGNETLGDEISAAISQIEGMLGAVDAAERKFLLSPASIADITDRLADAERTAVNALNMMKRLTTALKGARMVLNLLLRLWQLAV